ncbi:MAG: sulfurtransferase complex subunit TusB [Methanomassiliicoccales archaeon]|jgi:sulfur relay protein TusB/DsrH
MPSILFLLFKSPHEFGTSLEMIDKIAGDRKRAAILFEDAVYYAVDHQQGRRLLESAMEVFVMSDDLKARGFGGKVMTGFKEIEYPEAVDLIMERFDKTITL